MHSTPSMGVWKKSPITVRLGGASAPPAPPVPPPMRREVRAEGRESGGRSGLRRERERREVKAEGRERVEGGQG